MTPKQPVLVVSAREMRALLDSMPPHGIVTLSLPAAKLEEAPGGFYCVGAARASEHHLALCVFEMPPVDRELFDALEQADLARCRRALDAGADVDATDARSPTFDGGKPLHSAVGFSEAVRLLLNRGADPNARSASNWTPLMRACNVGCLESARLLLDAGADPSPLNDEGYTAYGRTSGDHPELLALLRERGAG